MADGLPVVDTSTYPRAGQGGSVLDTVGKLQGLEAQSIGIDQGKLKLINERYGVVSKELQGLIGDKDLDFNKVAGRFQNLVNLGLIPSDMMAQSLKDVPTDKAKIQDWLQMKLQQAQGIHEAINYGQGRPETFSDNTSVYQGRVSPKPGMGVKIDPNPIATNKLPVNTQVPEPETLNGQPNPNFGQTRFNAPASGPLVTPQQQPQAKPPLPVAPSNTGPISDPKILWQSDNFKGNVTGATVGPNLAQGGSGASGPISSMPPTYATGLQSYTEDQNLATAKLTAMRPAIQALPLIKGLTTGIGTETYNKALAGLNNLGWLPEGAANKVADYQVINKKLADYLRSSPLAARSDAAQALSQSASPDPKGQINKALVKLTKDAIILDRVQAARTGAFSQLDENGKPRLRSDFHNYGEHRSGFQGSVDEKAFGIDFMEPEERTKLLTDMDKKLNSDKTSERSEAQRFKRSLSIVDRLSNNLGIDLSQ